MADSIDRIFVHALSTVKRIPRTGATRPPPEDRLQLYGLYKQAMEGDVDGVMERPSTLTRSRSDPRTTQDLQKECDKWDAWFEQRGVSKTQAKRLYIEKLIETMKAHAHGTHDARELVAELEFVWEQIKNNGNSSGNTSPSAALAHQGAHVTNEEPHAEPPLQLLKPMSEEDEDEVDHEPLTDREGHGVDEIFRSPEQERKTRRWRRAMEHALIKMTAEVAALREQLASGRAYAGARRSRSAWLAYMLWSVAKHVVVDCVVLVLLLIWLRRRRDRRVEDALRSIGRVVGGYMRRLVPG